MRPSEVRLTVAAREAIVGAVRAAWPDEVVGALGGRRRDGVFVVEQLVRFAGAGRRDGFEVAPAAFLQAEHELGRAERTWQGFVHSHPGGSAAPSARDRDELWRHCVQLIVGGSDPHDLHTAAFWFDGDTCTPLPLSQPDPEPCA